MRAKGYMRYLKKCTKRRQTMVGMKIHMPIEKAVFLPNLRMMNCQKGIQAMEDTRSTTMT